MSVRPLFCSLLVSVIACRVWSTPVLAQDAPAAPVRFDGFVIEHEPSDSKLRIGGLIQADGVFFPDDDDERYDDGFVLRRVRPQLRGTVFKHFDFRIQFDVAASRLTLLDAYVDIALLDEVVLRVGKTKAPVGLERLQGAGDIALYERAFPTLLVPNRDIGTMLFGKLLGGSLEYAVGVFDGVPDGGSSEGNLGDGFEIAARLFAHPLKTLDNPWLQGLGLGVAGTWGEAEGELDATELPTFRTSGRATFFRYIAGDDPATSVLADGTRWRVTPQLSYYGGSLGITGEYVYSAQTMRLGDVRETVAHQAWQATLQFVATLDPVTARGVAVERPLDPASGGFGAIELLGRYHEFVADEAAFEAGFASRSSAASRASAWSAGVAWHFNTAVKLLAAFERTTFEGGADNGGPRPAENMAQTRLQLRF